jgi:hypothetical protein
MFLSQLNIDIGQLHNDLCFLFLLFARIPSSRYNFGSRGSFRLDPCKLQPSKILALPLPLLTQQVPLMSLYLLSLPEPPYIPDSLHLTNPLISCQRRRLRCDELAHPGIWVVNVILLPYLIYSFDAHSITQGVLSEETDERSSF